MSATQSPYIRRVPRREGGAYPTTRQGAFTRYLRALDTRGEPPPEAFADLWSSLRVAVVAELRRRCAWTSSPSYYGVYGWESWQTRDYRPGATGSALDELLTDCFAFVFLERLPRLRAQLEVKPNVDGLVVLYLRNYLHDRRKHHDLLGFRVFESLRHAVRQAVDAGELWVVGGKREVLSATVLAASKDADPGEAADAADLAPIVVGWTGELLPDLLTASGRRRPQVILRLKGCLLDLEGEGAPVFAFQALAGELKHSVRAVWAAVFDLTEGETAKPAGDDAAPVLGAVARLARPESGIEGRESFEKLVACVACHVEEARRGEELDARTLHYLRRLWGFLHVWAQSDDSDRLPSGRQLEKLLHIPRLRLPALWRLLKESILDCRLSLGGRADTKEQV